MKAEMYWIQGPWRGRLAIMPRPRGGDWLEDEIRDWRVEGIDIVVSTLTNDEIAELDIGREAEWCRKNGIEFIAFPITDRGVPQSVKATKKLMQQLEEQLSAGKSVAIHCRMGIGRSSMLAAGLLISSGVPMETAFERIKESRGCPVPDTTEQRLWVFQFAHQLVVPPIGNID